MVSKMKDGNVDLTQSTDETDIEKLQSTTAKGTLIFCMKCGAPATHFHDWKKSNEARLSCVNCGNTITVGNAIINMTFTTDALTLKLMEKGANTPPPEMKTSEEQRKNAKNNRPTSDKGWCQLNFRVTFGQRDVLRQAMAISKKANGFTGKTWHGAAIEDIAANYMAGNHPVGQIVDLSQVTPEVLENLPPKNVDLLLQFVFVKGINKAFASREEKHKYILANLPPEHIDDPNMKSDDPEELGREAEANGEPFDLDEGDSETPEDLPVAEEDEAAK